MVKLLARKLPVLWVAALLSPLKFGRLMRPFEERSSEDSWIVVTLECPLEVAGEENWDDSIAGRSVAKRSTACTPFDDDVPDELPSHDADRLAGPPTLLNLVSLFVLCPVALKLG